ncbi:MAG: tail fiber domain-containing protein, partial [Bacteroidales bacterium]
SETLIFNGNVGVGVSPGSYKLYVAGNAYSTGTWATSDIRWKKNIVPMGDALSRIVKLTGVIYNWRDDEFPEMKFDNKTHIGVIAQDVEKVFPELVNTDGKGYKAVAYDKLSVVLIEGIKQQQQQIQQLEKKNTELESKLKEIDILKTELETIKKLLIK